MNYNIVGKTFERTSKRPRKVPVEKKHWYDLGYKIVYDTVKTRYTVLEFAPVSGMMLLQDEGDKEVFWIGSYFIDGAKVVGCQVDGTDIQNL